MTSFKKLLIDSRNLNQEKRQHRVKKTIRNYYTTLRSEEEVTKYTAAVQGSSIPKAHIYFYSTSEFSKQLICDLGEGRLSITVGT